MSEITRKAPIPSFAGGVIDLAPALVFLAAYLVVPVSQDQKIFVATGAFMAATIAAAFASNIFAVQMLHIPWLSSLLVIVMGALTLWLQDEIFIKIKPTLYFGLLALWSGWTLLTSLPRLQKIGQRDALDSVDPEGRRKLTAFTAWACILMALLNEVIWRNSSTGFWIGFQLWGWALVEALILPLTLPVLRRHDQVYDKAKATDASPSE
jgi:intracellular septation protein